MGVAKGTARDGLVTTKMIMIMSEGDIVWCRFPVVLATRAPMGIVLCFDLLWYVVFHDAGKRNGGIRNF